MKHKIMLVAVIVAALVTVVGMRSYGISGCGWYSTTYIGPWGNMSCPDCDAWRTVDPGTCAGPALPDESCDYMSVPEEEDELCVAGLCRGNTVGYSMYVDCWVSDACAGGA